MSFYNTEFELVKRALNSALAQSFQDFEIIVIDDGSNQDLGKQILNFVKDHSQKITYLRHANCGQALSINKAVLISRGEYLTMLDSDDEYKKEHLASCLAEIKEFDLTSSSAEIIVDTEDDYYVPDKYDLNKMIHIDECILFATLFGKREVFEKIQFHEGYAADSDFYDLAMKKYKVRRLNLRTYIYYRNNPNSFTSKMKRNNSTPTKIK